MITDVVVVVPAADEQVLIERCLRALGRARFELADATGRTFRSVRTRCVVVLDDCHDATAAIVARFLDVECVAISSRRVGAARCAGVAHALHDLRDAPSTWIASTDADSQVPPDWLQVMVGAADAGTDVLLGTVVPDDLPPERRALWSAAHDLRDGHAYVHGANLGIRASTYLQAGGWDASLRVHEDVALVAAARAMDAEILAVAGNPVRTSARRINRVPGGFAEFLRELPATPDRATA